MSEMSLSLLSAAMVMTGLAIVSMFALRAWTQWITLRRIEMERAFGGPDHAEQAPSLSSRIEIADLRERVRKLEAIAAGVDL